MKKTLLLTFLGCSFFNFAQQEVPFLHCGATHAIEHQENLTPGYKQMIDDEFNMIQSIGPRKNNETYVVPVVFHVVYDTPQKNLADSVILRQLEILNNDFQRLNPDTVNMRSDFDIVKGNPNIQFQLANFDPNGNQTTGITRTETTTTSFGGLGIVTGDMSEFEAVKKSNEGGVDPWDQNRYLNIWICDMSIFNQVILLGYATPPNGLTNWPPGATAGLEDGVVMQFQAISDNNPNTIPGFNFEGRTLTHEVGHYLGLRHIWGDGNCSEEDGIDDTPNAVSESDFDCNPSKNTCVDNIYGIDLPDMIENYMDYSAESCQNTFTKGQVDHMRAVLENQRFGLIETANLITEELDVRLFPNPTDGIVNVEVSEPNIEKYFLYNIEGRLVKSGAVAGYKFQVDLKDCEKGAYFMHLQNNQGKTSVQKLIKQ